MNLQDNFTCEDDINELKQVQPELLIVLAWSIKYCKKNTLRCCVTSLVRCVDSFSVSNTHQTGRAFDLSVKGWSNQDIEDYTLFMTQKCNEYAAINTSGEKRLIVHHDVKGDHLHHQVRNC